MNRIMIAICVMALAACDNSERIRHVVEPVEVNIPIIERATAPKELFRTKLPVEQIPRWVAPSDPAATACVTQAGEPMLKSILLRNESLLDGWEAYGR